MSFFQKLIHIMEAVLFKGQTSLSIPLMDVYVFQNRTFPNFLPFESLQPKQDRFSHH
jgi:hypothetical protein